MHATSVRIYPSLCLRHWNITCVCIARFLSQQLSSLFDVKNRKRMKLPSYSLPFCFAYTCPLSNAILFLSVVSSSPKPNVLWMPHTHPSPSRGSAEHATKTPEWQILQNAPLLCTINNKLYQSLDWRRNCWQQFKINANLHKEDFAILDKSFLARNRRIIMPTRAGPPPEKLDLLS